MSLRLEVHVDSAMLAATPPVAPVRAVPGWVASQRRCRGECERCGLRGDTMYAGTGELLCWSCLDKAREAVR